MLPLYDYSMKAELWRRANRETASGLAPIMLRVTITKKRAEIASGIDVPAAYWNTTNHCLELPSRKELREAAFSAERVRELNAQLLELRAAADKAYRSLRQDYQDKRRTTPPSSRDVLEAVRGISKPVAAPLTVAQGFARFMDSMTATGINKSPATIASYRSRLGNLLEFFTDELKNKKFLLQDVNLPIARQLERWCLSQLTPDKSLRFGHASMAKQINMLQMVVAWAAIEGFVPANTLNGYKYQSTVEPRLPRHLPADEVARLAAAVFRPAHLAATVDMWLFCCYTALSHVDYCEFATDPVRYLHTDANGQEWIRMTRQKMRNRKPEGFSVPFFPEARAIFERRRGVLPAQVNSNVNRFLKIISQELGLSLQLTFKDSRSTFAQRWRDAGVSGAVVAAMMGDEERVLNKNYSRVREAAIGVELSRLNLGPAPTLAH